MRGSMMGVNAPRGVNKLNIITYLQRGAGNSCSVMYTTIPDLLLSKSLYLISFANTQINKSLAKYSIFKAQSSIIEKNTKHKTLVIPAQAGIQCVADIFLICPCGAMDTHLRGYDELK